MNINVTLKIDSPEVVLAIQTLAHAFQRGMDTTHVASIEPESNQITVTQDDENPLAKQSEVVAKAITIEEVRAKLAALSQAGKQKEVKALIEKYGGKKLTDIQSELYGELLKEAEVL